jgi:rubrerythrin
MSSENENTGKYTVKKSVEFNPDDVKTILREVGRNIVEKSEAETARQQAAMENFDVLRNEMAKKYKDNGFLQCDSPTSLVELVKQHQNDDVRRSPMGKVTYTNENQKGFSSHNAVIDLVYEVLRNPASTKEQKQEAEASRRRLLESTIHGKSMRQLKSVGLGSYKSRSSCFSCGRTLDEKDENSEECPHCGFRFGSVESGSAEAQKRRTWL